MFGFTFRLEIIILCIIFFYLIGGHMLFSCTKVSAKEGFQILKDVGSTINYSMRDGVPKSGCGHKNTEMEKDIPLPMGDDNFFTSTEFKD